jgi:putative spermidine/putrescine transport system permease protein
VIEPVLVWSAPLLLVAPLIFLFVGSLAGTWDSRGLAGFSFAGIVEAYGIVGDSILFSWCLALATAIITATIAVPLAYADKVGGDRLSRLLGELVLLPVVLPSLLLAMGLILAYPDLQGGWVILLIAHVAQTLPFAVWPVVSALSVMDVRTLDYAGRTLGASSLQRFVLLVLPNIWRAATTGAATAFVISFSETGSSLFLASAHYRPIGVLLVDSFLNLDQRISAATAVLFTLCLLPALVILEVTLGSGRQKSKRPATSPPSAGLAASPAVHSGARS